MSNGVADSFWNWAEVKYGRGGVKDMCLDLQDNSDQSVPLLLWAAWCAASGVRIDTHVAYRAAAMARAWSDAVIKPLRIVRGTLSTALHDSEDGECAGLRDQVTSAELQAEHALMNQLESLIPECPSSSTSNLKANTLGALQVVTTVWAEAPPMQHLPIVMPGFTQGLTKSENLRYNG